MGDTGYIDWHVIHTSTELTATAEGETYVYAFWPVDYRLNPTDRGVSLLKPEGRHPDWFLHAENADQVLSVRGHPLLAAVLLGTSSTTYRLANDTRILWSCERSDLDKRGRKLLKHLDVLYERAGRIITYTDLQPIDQMVPGADAGQATVSSAPGHA